MIISLYCNFSTLETAATLGSIIILSISYDGVDETLLRVELFEQHGNNKLQSDFDDVPIDSSCIKSAKTPDASLPCKGDEASDQVTGESLPVRESEML